MAGNRRPGGWARTPYRGRPANLPTVNASPVTAAGRALARDMARARLAVGHLIDEDVTARCNRIAAQAEHDAEHGDRTATALLARALRGHDA